ncbi:MAG: hypothetical protein Q7S68_00880, partial [Deltaproteobacteria bacterium]|nr:hypothetical protein [Deltaproteobacteria bacterium]
ARLRALGVPYYKIDEHLQLAINLSPQVNWLNKMMLGGLVTYWKMMDQLKYQSDEEFDRNLDRWMVSP